MADILVCDYALPGRAGNAREFLATGLGDGRGRYRLTPAGRLLRIETQKTKGSEPYSLTGVVHLRPMWLGARTEYLLTFASGVVQATHAVPVRAPETRTKELNALGREELALRRVVGRATQKMFARLKKVDPEIVALAMLVFDDCDKAATWLSRPHPLLGSRSPLNLIATGRRQAVLKALNAILYGLPV